MILALTRLPSHNNLFTYLQILYNFEATGVYILMYTMHLPDYQYEGNSGELRVKVKVKVKCTCLVGECFFPLTVSSPLPIPVFFCLGKWKFLLAQLASALKTLSPPLNTYSLKIAEAVISLGRGVVRLVELSWATCSEISLCISAYCRSVRERQESTLFVLVLIWNETSIFT